MVTHPHQYLSAVTIQTHVLGNVSNVQGVVRTSDSSPELACKHDAAHKLLGGVVYMCMCRHVRNNFPPMGTTLHQGKLVGALCEA